MKLIVERNGFRAPHQHVDGHAPTRTNTCTQTATNVTHYRLTHARTNIHGLSTTSNQSNPNESKRTIKWRTQLVYATGTVEVVRNAVNLNAHLIHTEMEFHKIMCSWSVYGSYCVPTEKKCREWKNIATTAEPMTTTNTLMLHAEHKTVSISIWTHVQSVNRHWL